VRQIAGASCERFLNAVVSLPEGSCVLRRPRIVAWIRNSAAFTNAGRPTSNLPGPINSSAPWSSQPFRLTSRTRRFSRCRAPGMKRGTGWSYRHPRPFLGLVQPVFHFFPGDRGAPTAHDLQIVKLTLRIHCKLRHKTRCTLAASWRTLIKDFVIHHG
jgi:hypothetical protein